MLETQNSTHAMPFTPHTPCLSRHTRHAFHATHAMSCMPNTRDAISFMPSSSLHLLHGNFFDEHISTLSLLICNLSTLHLSLLICNLSTLSLLTYSLFESFVSAAPLDAPDVDTSSQGSKGIYLWSLDMNLLDKGRERERERCISL